MKRSLVSSAIAACAFAAIASSAQAADGTINITGDITATTCLVNGNLPGSGSGTDKAVKLNTSSVKSLSSAGMTGGDMRFNIQVGGAGDTGCAKDTEVAVAFDLASPLIDKTTGRLDVTGTNKDLVQVQILDEDGRPLNLNTEQSKTHKVDATNTASVPLIARFYALDAAVPEAGISTNVGFQVVYP